MLKLSTYHHPRTGVARFILAEPDGHQAYDSTDLGLVFDWLDDNHQHQIWLHTGTRKMTISINRHRT